MAPVQSKLDFCLLVVPMIVVMFGTLLRLDGLLARPGRPKMQGRRFSDWDAQGRPICHDPDVVSFGGGFQNRRAYVAYEEEEFQTQVLADKRIG